MRSYIPSATTSKVTPVESGEQSLSHISITDNRPETIIQRQELLSAMESGRTEDQWQSFSEAYGNGNISRPGYQEGEKQDFGCDLPASGIQLGGGYDGAQMIIPSDKDSAPVLLHELGHALEGHDPGAIHHGAEFETSEVKYSIDAASEREADEAGIRVQEELGATGVNAIMSTLQSWPTTVWSSEATILPILIDGWGTPMTEASIAKLLKLAEYRHDKEEATFLATQIKSENKEVRQITLPQFVEKLKGANYQATKRAGHMLELLMHEYLDEFQTERNGHDAEATWDQFLKLTMIIKGWSEKLNNPGEEALLEPEKFEIPVKNYGEYLACGQMQWQAAAVAAMRSGHLTGIGFLELKRALEEATAGTRNVVRLRLTRDVIHESGLQNKVTGDLGTANIPKYTFTEKNLNEAMKFFTSSGYYYEKLGVILKSLDVGHKLIDKWENQSHRTKGKQVDPGTDFKFLALLSPKPKGQEVIGANGQVLGDGSYMFVIDAHFRFRYMAAANFVGEGGTAKNFFQFIPHSQLAALDLVAAAGNFVIKKGKFLWIDNGSGHYRVSANLNELNTRACLNNLGYKLKNVKFLDRGAGQLDAIYKTGNQHLKGLPNGEDRPAMTPEIRAIQKVMDGLK